MTLSRPFVYSRFTEDILPRRMRECLEKYGKSRMFWRRINDVIEGSGDQATAEKMFI